MVRYQRTECWGTVSIYEPAGEKNPHRRPTRDHRLVSRVSKAVKGEIRGTGDWMMTRKIEKAKE